MSGLLVAGTTSDAGRSVVTTALCRSLARAGAEPEAAMNPVLLKPGSDLRSHPVMMGRAAGEVGARDFAGRRDRLTRAAYDAFDDLASRYAVVVVPRGTALGAAASGYEIHHGAVSRGAGAEEVLGGARAGHVFGTMWHGALEGDGFRTAFLTEVARLTGHVWEPSGVTFRAARERRLELLADLVEEHLDVAAIAGLATEDAPAGLPVLPPGADR